MIYFGSENNLAAALNSAVSLETSNWATCSFRLVIPTGGTVTFEGSCDGVSYMSISARNIVTDVFTTTASVTGDFTVNVANFRKFRVRVSTAGSASGSVIGTLSEQASLDVAFTNALPAGTNNIGDIDIASAPTGTSAMQVRITDGTTIASVQAASSALKVSNDTSAADNSVFTGGSSNIGAAGYLFDTTPPAVTDGNIGAARMNSSRILMVGDADAIANLDASGDVQVDVLTLPALVAGTANIGDVDVLTLPALVAGTANIGDVDVLTLPSIPAGVNNIGDVDVLTLPSTNLAAGNLVQIDYDTGAGTQNMPMAGMALPASGGAVAGGTSTNPIRVDPTGTTIQPVSGTVTANAGTGPFPVSDNAGSLTVDAPAGTPVANRLSDGTAFLTTTGGRLSVDASGVAVPVTDNAGSLTVDGTITANAGTGNFTIAQVTAANLNAQVVGNIAHDAVDSGNPEKIGMRAIAHSTNPVAVAVGDRTDWLANRAGVPWVIGGHPNVVTVRANYTAAQTDVAVVTVAAGLKIVVTRCSVLADNANTVDVQARIGFGATTTPTTTGVVLSHPGIAAGSGVIEGSGSGILGIGADGEDLRITSEVPTTGSIDVVVSYYTIES